LLLNEIFDELLLLFNCRRNNTHLIAKIFIGLAEVQFYHALVDPNRFYYSDRQIPSRLLLLET
jgi:hypothetical protein